jgi:hypothetical protein
MKTTFAAALVATLSVASTVSATPAEDNTLNIPLQKRQDSSPLTQADGAVNWNVLNVSFLLALWISSISFQRLISLFRFFRIEPSSTRQGQVP